MTEVEKEWYNAGYTVGFHNCKEKALEILNRAYRTGTVRDGIVNGKCCKVLDIWYDPLVKELIEKL